MMQLRIATRGPGAIKRYTSGAFAGLLLFSALELAAADKIIITVDATQTRPISPWIYGINAYESLSEAPRNLTLNRTGGNRWTAYNWETNFSNGGSDWGPYNNDDHLSSSSTPAEAVRQIMAADRSRSNASLITVQMQGYVAADKGGKVDVSDPDRLANRFKRVVYQLR